MSLHNSKWPPLRKKNSFRNYVMFDLHNFKIGNIAAVKSISGIKGGYVIRFSLVNCPRYSCDDTSFKLRCLILLRRQKGALCMSQQLTTPI